MTARLRIDRSRAVVAWRVSGRPLAVVKRVCSIPSSRAFSVIIWVNRPSEPPMCSAMTTAMSLALRTAVARMASSRLIV